jgi:GNAT superfamily N-acetyltransferase
MGAPFLIRSMRSDELVFGVGCTLAEGWVSEASTALNTFEGFYRHDPAGCLIALQDDTPAGICVATPYKHTGFVGELIVRPEMRGKGLGGALLSRVMEYLRGLGIGSIYLDGVLTAVP